MLGGGINSSSLKELPTNITNCLKQYQKTITLNLKQVIEYNTKEYSIALNFPSNPKLCFIKFTGTPYNEELSNEDYMQIHNNMKFKIGLKQYNSFVANFTITQLDKDYLKFKANELGWDYRCKADLISIFAIF